MLVIKSSIYRWILARIGILACVYEGRSELAVDPQKIVNLVIDFVNSCTFKRLILDQINKFCLMALFYLIPIKAMHFYNLENLRKFIMKLIKRIFPFR